MNKLLLSLSLSLLSTGALFSAVDSEFLRNAITTQNVEAVEACVLAGVTYDESTRAGLIEAARTEVDQLENSILKKVEPIEVISLGITLASIAALGKISYDEWFDKQDNLGKYSKWKAGSFFTLGLAKFGETAIKLYKDVKANSKKTVALKRAEQIVGLVERLNVR